MLFEADFWGGADMFGRLAPSTVERGKFFLFYSYTGISGNPLTESTALPLACICCSSSSSCSSFHCCQVFECRSIVTFACLVCRRAIAGSPGVRRGCRGHREATCRGGSCRSSGRAQEHLSAPRHHCSHAIAGTLISSSPALVHTHLSCCAFQALQYRCNVMRFRLTVLCILVVQFAAVARVTTAWIH